MNKIFYEIEITKFNSRKILNLVLKVLLLFFTAKMMERTAKSIKI